MKSARTPGSGKGVPELGVTSGEKVQYRNCEAKSFLQNEIDKKPVMPLSEKDFWDL